MDRRRDFRERCAPWGTKDAAHGTSDNELVIRRGLELHELPALCSTEAAFFRLPARSIRISFQSELHDRKTRHTTKVAEIDGQHRVAKRHSCGPDEQVSERNDHTLALLLAVEFPGQHGRLFRVWVHGQVR